MARDIAGDLEDPPSLFGDSHLRNQATARLLEGAEACGEKFEIFAKPLHALVIVERLRAIKAK